MLTAEAVRNFGNVSDDQQTIRKKIELPFIRILEIEIPEKNKKQIFNLKINAPHFSHFSEIIFGFYCSTMSGIYLWRCMQHVDFLTNVDNYYIKANIVQMRVTFNYINKILNAFVV